MLARNATQNNHTSAVGFISICFTPEAKALSVSICPSQTAWLMNDPTLFIPKERELDFPSVSSPGNFLPAPSNGKTGDLTPLQGAMARRPTVLTYPWLWGEISNCQTHLGNWDIALRLKNQIVRTNFKIHRELLSDKWAGCDETGSHTVWWEPSSWHQPQLDLALEEPVCTLVMCSLGISKLSWLSLSYAVV